MTVFHSRNKFSDIKLETSVIRLQKLFSKTPHESDKNANFADFITLNCSVELYDAKGLLTISS